MPFDESRVSLHLPHLVVHLQFHVVYTVVPKRDRGFLQKMLSSRGIPITTNMVRNVAGRLLVFPGQDLQIGQGFSASLG